jgi:hypothetical protein
LKEEALDCPMWRARFGRDFGPVVRQITKWMNEWIYIYIYSLRVINTVSEQMTVTVCWLYIKVVCRFYSLHCCAKKDIDSIVLLLVLETRI